MKKSDITTYTPERFINAGMSGWQDMLRSILRSRELVWRLFLRDFRSKYRQSLFGVLWAVLNPLVIVGVFMFLNRSGIVNINETGVPYPLYAAIGITFFGLFSTGLVNATNSIIGAGTMVSKINFPKISLVISSFGPALVEFGVRSILIAALFTLYGVMPDWKSIFILIAALPLMLLSLGLGFITSLLAGIFRDMGQIVSLAATFLLFLTPVLYPAPRQGIFVVIDAWNPVSHVIVGCRDLILAGSLSNGAAYFWSSVISGIVFLLCWRVFYLSETRIAERI